MMSFPWLVAGSILSKEYRPAKLWFDTSDNKKGIPISQEMPFIVLKKVRQRSRWQQPGLYSLAQCQTLREHLHREI